MISGPSGFLYVIAQTIMKVVLLRFLSHVQFSQQMSQNSTVYVCVRYSEDWFFFRLWFILWLSLRLKITSEFSLASVRCDWQWPTLCWAPPFCTASTFLFGETWLFLSSHPKLSETTGSGTPMAISLCLNILSSLHLRASEFEHLMSQVSPTGLTVSWLPPCAKVWISEQRAFWQPLNNQIIMTPAAFCCYYSLMEVWLCWHSCDESNFICHLTLPWLLSQVPCVHSHTDLYFRLRLFFTLRCWKFDLKNPEKINAQIL